MGGQVYQWTDANRDGVFQTSETGPLLRRFGGQYSAIDANLHQPYTDQVSASVGAAPIAGLSLSLRAFVAEDKNRMAALNTGVPFSAYQLRQVTNPQGGTASVYEQNATTLGNDQFRLTNPAGLAMTHRGLTAEAVYQHSNLAVSTYGFVGKSWGQTNQGSQAWQNDSGVVGSLFSDPNATLFAAGRPAMDRGYGMRTSAFVRTHSVEILFSSSLIGGSPYSPELLATGLAQGPTLVATSARGSLRTSPIFQQNLRLVRPFAMRHGKLQVSAEVYNLWNRATALSVNDLIGVSFGQPLAIQPPRSLRLGVGYSF